MPYFSEKLSSQRLSSFLSSKLNSTCNNNVLHFCLNSRFACAAFSPNNHRMQVSADRVPPLLEIATSVCKSPNLLLLLIDKQTCLDVTDEQLLFVLRDAPSLEDCRGSRSASLHLASSSAGMQYVNESHTYFKSLSHFRQGAIREKSLRAMQRNNWLLKQPRNTGQHGLGIRALCK